MITIKLFYKRSLSLLCIIMLCLQSWGQINNTKQLGILDIEISKEQVFQQECDQLLDNSNLEDDLLLHYALDGNTIDLGPNMINGVNNGGIVTSDRFDDQSAFSFDGNSNIIIPHDDSYKVQFPISVSTWVKWESDISNKNSVFSTNFEQDNYHGVFMLRLAASGKLFFGYGTGTGGITLENRRAIISDTETELNTWYHIVGVINGPNDFYLYIDGCEETFTYSGDENPVIAYNSNSGFLGKLDNSNSALSNDLIGAIDDFYFWNRSITEEEVLYLYDRFEVPEITLNNSYLIPTGEDAIDLELPNVYTDVVWSDGQTGNEVTFSEEGIYQVEAFYNCHIVCAEFTVENEIISNTDEDELLNISISPFPNPTASQVSFYTSGKVSDFEIRTDRGELIEVPFTRSTDLVTLDMSHLVNGVYFLFIRDNERVANKKIIKID